MIVKVGNKEYPFRLTAYAYKQITISFANQSDDIDSAAHLIREGIKGGIDCLPFWKRIFTVAPSKKAIQKGMEMGEIFDIVISVFGEAQKVGERMPQPPVAEQ